MAAEFVPTRSGGRYLTLDGFMFIINRKVGSRVFWRCSDRGICKATVSTDSVTDEILDRTKAHHNHSSHKAKIIKMKKLGELKAAVKMEAHQPIKRLYSQVFESDDTTDTEAAASVPSFQNLRSILYRERKKLITAPPKEKTDNDLEATQWGQTLNSPLPVWVCVCMCVCVCVCVCMCRMMEFHLRSEDLHFCL